MTRLLFEAVMYLLELKKAEVNYYGNITNYPMTDTTNLIENMTSKLESEAKRRGWK